MPVAYSYVRFSSPEQAKGHSLKRQVDAARIYAEENGLQLDSSLKADKGVSAFDQSNVTKGNLGLFLRSIDDGLIPRGSVLIIESLDRLSRADLLSALELFTSIIRRGVRIVTLADGREYDEESIRSNPFDLFASLMVMQRANEESAMKSQRVAAAWKRKRDNAENVKMTAICPDWMELDREKNEFKIIPDRGALVRRIFEMSKNGHGQGFIERTLNREGIEPWGRGKKKGVGWHSSTIYKILTNAATIGRYEPHTQPKGKKRVPTGQLIEGYYPAVIEASLFFEVRRLRELRRPEIGSGTEVKRQRVVGNRKGKLNTIFTGLARCGYCGNTMRFQSKGRDSKKGGRYLVCSSALMGKGCRYLSVPYENFENVFLSAVRDLDLANLVGENANNDQIARRSQEITAGEELLKDIPRRIGRLTEAIASGDFASPPASLVEKIQELENQKKLAMQRVEDLQRQLLDKKSESVRAESLRDLLLKLEHHLGSLEGNDLLEFRTRLSSQLRSVVEEVRIYPRNHSIHRTQVGKLNEWQGDLPPEIQLSQFAVGELPDRWPKLTKDRPLVFLLRILNGAERLVIQANGSLNIIGNVSKAGIKNPLLALPTRD